MTIPNGYSKQTINGHAYTVYRQKDGQKIGVLSAGGKNLKSIVAHDSTDVLIYAKIVGANGLSTGSYLMISGKGIPGYLKHTIPLAKS